MLLLFQCRLWQTTCQNSFIVPEITVVNIVKKSKTRYIIYNFLRKIPQVKSPDMRPLPPFNDMVNT